MTDASLAVLFLGLITACFVTLAITALCVARDVPRTLRHVNEVLPHADQALNEASHALHQARQLFAKANRASRDVETVVRETCDTALEALSRIARWRERAEGFLKEHFGNGSGADPRRHHGRR